MKMSKGLLVVLFANLFLVFNFATTSFASDLRLKIVTSAFENSRLYYLKVDYQIDSKAGTIEIEPFSYGVITRRESFAFELNNTLHFCVDEKGVVFPRELGYWQYETTNAIKLGTNSKYDTDYIKLAPIHHSSSGDKFDRQLIIFKPNVWYFRFCLVNVKNEGYVVSNLFSFKLNSDYEICDSKNITWSEMPEAAQKSLETLIITKARELKETFTPEMIINRINHWQK
ncbi:MAG: hypothetical protein ACQETH_15515 [Candidatus Rifleibacteriota bacterium]